jgi:hypothetical protein
MIFEVLQILTEELNNFFGKQTISLENVSGLDDKNDTSSDFNGVYLTLVNNQEEFVLKNQSNDYREGNKIVYKNPKVNLSLYILFSASETTYQESLKSISKIIRYFQGKRVFTQSNTFYNRDDSEMQNIKNFRFVVDLFSPSFEELNYIWGTLGGKQYPSVLYKISTIELEREIIQRKGSLIAEINTIIKNV